MTGPMTAIAWRVPCGGLASPCSRTIRSRSMRTAALWVAGVGDLRERRPDLEAALAPVPEGVPVLLLSHDPDVFPTVPGRVLLTLSGHTHGGQVNLPLVRGHLVPSRFGDRYGGGHVKEGARHLFVSREIGSAGLPVRFLVPPEIAVLTLVSRSDPPPAERL